jgi:hypothetical protein
MSGALTDPPWLGARKHLAPTRTGRPIRGTRWRAISAHCVRINAADLQACADRMESGRL